MNVNKTAYRQYVSRPRDDRRTSLVDMLMTTQTRRAHSRERQYTLGDLTTVAHEDGVLLKSPKGVAQFTNWSFGQWTRLLGQRADSINDLPAPMIADILNYRLAQKDPKTPAVLLAQAPNGAPQPMVRAVTSKTYGRVWTADLVDGLMRELTANDPQWKLPTAWDGKPAGAYTSDRDDFLILINGGSIVDDPSAMGGNGQMFRGIMLRNSEVGACSVIIETLLFRYICGNLMLCGAMMDRRYRRRHVGTKVLRDALREIRSYAVNFASQSAERDTAIVRGLIDREYATTKDAVIAALKEAGMTKDAAETAYNAAEQYEANPRSFWGIANGITRISQGDYQDERYQLDQIAAAVMARGAKLVAAGN